MVNLFPQSRRADPAGPGRFSIRWCPMCGTGKAWKCSRMDQVVSTSHVDGATTEYQPFFSFRHAGPAPARGAFYHAAGRPAVTGVEGPPRSTCLWWT